MRQADRDQTPSIKGTIGDHKQLPAVVQQNTEQSAIYDESLLSIGLTNLKDSLFERLYRSCTATVQRSYDMLCRQGRMHPEVALYFAARQQAVAYDLQSTQTYLLHLFRLLHVHRGCLTTAVRIYEDHQTDFDESRTFGIITPYRSQMVSDDSIW